MLKLARKAAAATLISGMLSVGVAAPAMAQQDGLVNVNIEDVTILENVAVGVAAQAAANVCGVKVGPVAVLAIQVDRSGDTQVVCEADATELDQTVTITD